MKNISSFFFTFGLSILILQIISFIGLNLLLIKFNFYWLGLILSSYFLDYLYKNVSTDYFKRLLVYALIIANGLMMYGLVLECSHMRTTTTYTDFCINFAFITRNDEFASINKFTNLTTLLLFEIAFLLKQKTIKVQTEGVDKENSINHNLRKYLNLLFIIFLAIIFIHYTQPS